MRSGRSRVPPPDAFSNRRSSLEECRYRPPGGRLFPTASKAIFIAENYSPLRQNRGNEQIQMLASRRFAAAVCTLAVYKKKAHFTRWSNCRFAASLQVIRHETEEKTHKIFLGNCSPYIRFFLAVAQLAFATARSRCQLADLALMLYELRKFMKIDWVFVTGHGFSRAFKP